MMCGATRTDKMRNEHITGTARVTQSSTKITENESSVKPCDQDERGARGDDECHAVMPGRMGRGRPNIRWKDVCMP